MTRQDPEQQTTAPDGRPMRRQPAWRQDFPIDWPEDIYVARRDFTKFLVLTSLAFAVGQVCIGVQNALRRTRGLPPKAPITRLADIPVGTTLPFNYPAEHDPCLLVRTGENAFLAFSQKCTHLSCAVVPDVKAKCFNCPCHEGVFDLQTGRPLAGPPRRPLPRITLEIVNDTLYATGVEVTAS
jgi:nitrite reductase/ring-hydroxylating ferredoxin subunit